jgi:hypothetical protein
VWTKETYRLWEHEKGLNEELARLGDAVEELPLSAFGIDFVPVVWVPFRSVGDQRGVGAFTLQLDKIDEANRQATRLHQMLFRYNRALWALMANATDGAGRPLPPPRLGPGVEDTLDVEDDSIIKLPGMTTLQSLVAQIQDKDALAILDAQIQEIEQDLPELAYFRLRDAGELSGRAVRLLLGDAIDRLIEVRGNGEAGMIRAQQMALTMGANAGIFQDIGTYEAGDFDHSFTERDPFPLTAGELAETAKVMTDAGFPLMTAARYVGFTETEMKELAQDIAEEQQRAATLAQAYMNQAEANASRNGGEFGGNNQSNRGDNG